MQASETEKTEVSMLDFNKATCNDNNPKHLYNIYTMLDQRRGRWADVV